MADGSMVAGEKKGFLSGRPMKRVLKMGVAGVAYAVVSDAVVEEYITDDSDSDSGLGVETKRGAAQVVGGLVLGGVIQKWDRDAAVGVAAAGVVAGGVRIAKDQGWDEDVRGWFTDDSSSSTTTSTSSSTSSAGRARRYG